MAIALNCPHCRRNWQYNGKKAYTTCPSCKGSVKTGTFSSTPEVQQKIPILHQFSLVPWTAGIFRVGAFHSEQIPDTWIRASFGFTLASQGDQRLVPEILYRLNEEGWADDPWLVRSTLEFLAPYISASQGLTALLSLVKPSTTDTSEHHVWMRVSALCYRQCRNSFRSSGRAYLANNL
jgi:hypothetical protein